MTSNAPEPHQIAHLDEHIDQFLSKTGAKSIEAYFKSEEAMSYEAVCSMLDIDPVPNMAALQAKVDEEFKEVTFANMNAREHRKAAGHGVFCPSHGVAQFLMGKSMGDNKQGKIDSLKAARDGLQEAIDHLSAAINAYEDADAS